jgi:hypothetical protein
LPAVRLRDVAPTRWQGSVRSGMDPRVQISEVSVKVCRVVVPRHAIDAGRRALLQREERGAQDVDADVMQERRQLLLAVPGDGFTYAVLRLGHGFPALSPDRALQFRIPLDPAASLHRLRGGSLRLVHRLPWYYRQVRLLGAVHRRLRLSPSRRGRFGDRRQRRSPGSRAEGFAYMPGSLTAPGRRRACDGGRRSVAFCHCDSIGTREFTFAAQWLACTIPCQRFDDALASAAA